MALFPKQAVEIIQSSTDQWFSENKENLAPDLVKLLSGTRKQILKRIQNLEAGEVLTEDDIDAWYNEINGMLRGNISQNLQAINGLRRSTKSSLKFLVDCDPKSVILDSFLQAGIADETVGDDGKHMTTLRPFSVGDWSHCPFAIKGYKRVNWASFFNSLYLSMKGEISNSDSGLFDIIEEKTKDIRGQLYDREVIARLIKYLFRDTSEVHVEGKEEYYQNAILQNLDGTEFVEQWGDTPETTLRPFVVANWMVFDDAPTPRGYGGTKWCSFFNRLFIDLQTEMKSSGFSNDEEYIRQKLNIQNKLHDHHAIALLLKYLFRKISHVRVEDKKEYYQNVILQSLAKTEIAERAVGGDGKIQITLRPFMINDWARLDVPIPGYNGQMWAGLLGKVFNALKGEFEESGSDMTVINQIANDVKKGTHSPANLFNRRSIALLMQQVFLNRPDVVVDMTENKPSKNRTRKTGTRKITDENDIKHHIFTLDEEDQILDAMAEIEDTRRQNAVSGNLETLAEHKIERIREQIGVSNEIIRKKWDSMAEILGIFKYDEKVQDELFELIAASDAGTLSPDAWGEAMEEISQRHHIDLRYLEKMYVKLERSLKKGNVVTTPRRKNITNLREFPAGLCTFKPKSTQETDRFFFNLQQNFAELIKSDASKNPLVVGLNWQSRDGFNNLILPLPFKATLKQYTAEETRIIEAASAWLLGHTEKSGEFIKSPVADIPDVAVDKTVNNPQNGCHRVGFQRVRLVDRDNKTVECLELYVSPPSSSPIREPQKSSFVGTGNEEQILFLSSLNRKLDYEEGDRRVREVV